MWRILFGEELFKGMILSTFSLKVNKAETEEVVRSEKNKYYT